MLETFNLTCFLLNIIILEKKRKTQTVMKSCWFHLGDANDKFSMKKNFQANCKMVIKIILL